MQALRVPAPCGSSGTRMQVNCDAIHVVHKLTRLATRATTLAALARVPRSLCPTFHRLHPPPRSPASPATHISSLHIAFRFRPFPRFACEPGATPAAARLQAGMRGPRDRGAGRAGWLLPLVAALCCALPERGRAADVPTFKIVPILLNKTEALNYAEFVKPFLDKVRRPDARSHPDFSLDARVFRLSTPAARPRRTIWPSSTPRSSANSRRPLPRSTPHPRCGTGCM